MASIDDLVSSVYRQIRADLVEVTVCGEAVRVTRHDLPGAYIQSEPPLWWKAESLYWWRVYMDGDYLCGMETILDAFRAIQLIRDIQGANNVGHSSITK